MEKGVRNVGIDINSNFKKNAYIKGALLYKGVLEVLTSTSRNCKNVNFEVVIGIKAVVTQVFYF